MKGKESIKSDWEMKENQVTTLFKKRVFVESRYGSREKDWKEQQKMQWLIALRCADYTDNDKIGKYNG